MLDSGCVHEGLPDQRGVRANVRLVGFQTETDEADEPWRSGWTEEQQTDLRVAAYAVGQEKSRVGSVQQDVHPTRASREVVQGEPRIGGRPMAHYEEAAHPGPNDRDRIRIRPNSLYLSYETNNSKEGEGLETGKGLEGLPMERDEGELEGLRDRDPADLFAAGRMPRRRTPINRAGPFSMRERTVDGGPSRPDLNHGSGLFLHEHGKRGSLGESRRDLPSRKSPEAAEQRPRFAPNQQHPPLRFDEGERDGHRYGLFPIGGNRNLDLLARGPREALTLERTSGACRTGRSACRRAAVPPRLVGCARGSGRDFRGGAHDHPASEQPP